jgi:hypothetical protein
MTLISKNNIEGSIMNTATAVRSRPIIFSGPMVQAILAGRKSQTRRVIDLSRVSFKPSWVGWVDHPDDGPGWYAQDVDAPYGELAEFWGEQRLKCPYGAVGDLLWVRETFAARQDVDPVEEPDKARHYALYRADGTSLDEPHWHSHPSRWTPLIHMPRWASRITLRITGVRVERLQGISEDDAKFEGSPLKSGSYSHRTWFRELWTEINGKRSGCDWASNPWVWAISFERLEEASK